MLLGSSGQGQIWFWSLIQYLRCKLTGYSKPDRSYLTRFVRQAALKRKVTLSFWSNRHSFESFRSCLVLTLTKSYYSLCTSWRLRLLRIAAAQKSLLFESRPASASQSWAYSCVSTVLFLHQTRRFERLHVQDKVCQVLTIFRGLIYPTSSWSLFWPKFKVLGHSGHPFHPKRNLLHNQLCWKIASSLSHHPFHSNHHKSVKIGLIQQVP